jgi:hypothetical protein
MLRQFGVEMKTAPQPAQQPRYRIVKVVEDGAYLRFQVEVFTSHWACDDDVWLPAEQGDGYRTLEGAERRVQELLNPAPKISREVVATY